jgi:hypothetical protein
LNDQIVSIHVRLSLSLKSNPLLSPSSLE